MNSQAVSTSALIIISSLLSAPAQAADPAVFVEKRVEKVLRDLKGRPVIPVPAAGKIPSLAAGWSKESWVKSIYGANLVEANWATQMLSDKLMAYRVFEQELGPSIKAYFPKTIGLREFLKKQNLIKPNGELEDGEKIEEALHDQFPAGFMVRPAVGVSPSEKAHGLFDKTDQFLVALTKKDNALYQPSHAAKPVRSHILNSIASGEAVVLQDDFVATSALQDAKSKGTFKEIRIHTFEYQVVPDSTPRRWFKSIELSSEDILRAEAFVTSFLNDIKSNSPRLLQRVALGFDVGRTASGDLRMVEVVSNRGQKTAWSGYLDQPRVLGAYSRHFESLNLAHFSGASGIALRANLANYLPYWELKRERSTGTMAKIFAFFPPVP